MRNIQVKKASSRRSGTCTWPRRAHDDGGWEVPDGGTLCQSYRWNMGRHGDRVTAKGALRDRL